MDVAREFRSVALTWAGRGFWAISDQVLFAGTNFVFNLLLARNSDPAAYGAFAIAFTVFLIISTLHTALITDPMLIYGAERYASFQPTYLAVLFYWHFLLCAGLALALALAGAACWLVGLGELPAAFLAVAGASPFIPLVWLVRRACYIRFEPHRAAIAGLGYLVLMLAGLFVLERAGLFSVVAALAMMSLSAIIVALWLLVAIKPSFSSVSRDFFWEVTRRHFNLGRWGAGVGLLSGAEGLLYIALPFHGDLAASGALKALTNLTLPMISLSIGLSTLVAPTLARRAARGSIRSITMAVIAAEFAIGLGYWLFLGVGRTQIFDLVYAGQYREVSPLVWIIGAQPIAIAAGHILSRVLMVRDRPEFVFWSYLLFAAYNAVFGVLLCLVFGIQGAVISIVLGSSIASLSQLLLLRTLDRRSVQRVS